MERASSSKTNYSITKYKSFFRRCSEVRWQRLRSVSAGALRHLGDLVAINLLMLILLRACCLWWLLLGTSPSFLVYYNISAAVRWRGWSGSWPASGCSPFFSSARVSMPPRPEASSQTALPITKIFLFLVRYHNLDDRCGREVAGVSPCSHIPVPFVPSISLSTCAVCRPSPPSSLSSALAH